MSPAEFRCHRELPNGQKCQAALGVRTPLGLVPLVPVERINYRGVAELRCPACGALREFKPKGRDAPENAHGMMLAR